MLFNRNSSAPGPRPSFENEIGLEDILSGTTRTPIALNNLLIYARNQDVAAEAESSTGTCFESAILFLISLKRYEGKFVAEPDLSSLPFPFHLSPAPPSKSRSKYHRTSKSLPLRPTLATAPPDIIIQPQSFPRPPLSPNSMISCENSTGIALFTFEESLDHEGESTISPLFTKSMSRHPLDSAKDVYDPFYHPSPRIPLSSGSLPSSPSPYRKSVNPVKNTSTPIYTKLKSATVVVPPDRQVMRTEMNTLIEVYLEPGGRESLQRMIDEEILVKVRSEARLTTNPALFQPLKSHLSTLLESLLIPSFVSTSTLNISSATALRRLILSIIFAIILLLLSAFFIFFALPSSTTPSTPPHSSPHPSSPTSAPPLTTIPRGWRMFTIPFTALSLALIIVSQTRFCWILFLRSVRERTPSSNVLPSFRSDPTTFEYRAQQSRIYGGTTSGEEKDKQKRKKRRKDRWWNVGGFFTMTEEGLEPIEDPHILAYQRRKAKRWLLIWGGLLLGATILIEILPGTPLTMK